MSHPQACKRVEGLWVRTKTEEHTVELKTEPKHSSVKPRKRKWFNNNNKSTSKPEINENQTWWFNVTAQKQTMMCGNKVEEMMNRVRTWKSLTPAKRKEKEMPPAKSSVSGLFLYLEDSLRNLFGCSLFSSSSSKLPSPKKISNSQEKAQAAGHPAPLTVCSFLQILWTRVDLWLAIKNTILVPNSQPCMDTWLFEIVTLGKIKLQKMSPKWGSTF